MSFNIRTLQDLKNFEDSCIMIIVRNPTKDNHKPAKSWHGTQSYYYMPLITEAYYRAKNIPVPQEILNMSGRITLLKRNPIYDSLIDIKYYTNEGYEEIIQKIIAYLNKDNNLNKLESFYSQDTNPIGNNEGHINGDNQVEILQGAGIIFIIESMIEINFNNP